MTPRQLIRTLGAMTLGASIAIAAVGCKGVDKGRKGRTVKASMQPFDPNADIGFEFGDGGGEGGASPDDYEVRSALDQQLPHMDTCVADYKAKKGIKPEKQLEGDVSIAVKLNPKSHAPLGINTKITSDHDKDESLKTCIKEAVDKAPFPTYAGMPRIVDFEFQLDPGSEWVEE